MKLSVALCTYNGSKYIEEQINSILNQTINVDEIIVCDDLSTDNTIEILKKFNRNTQ
jgi:glycosyltransferase involved in cell wall biosynthesis